MVAHSLVYQKTTPTQFYGVNLPAGIAWVEVIKVLEPFFYLKVHEPPVPNCDRLGLCKGYFLKWQKELITLAVVEV